MTKILILRKVANEEARSFESQLNSKMLAILVNIAALFKLIDFSKSLASSFCSFLRKVSKILKVSGFSIFLLSSCLGFAANDEFAEASIRVEQNTTDEDIEIVIEAKSESEGLVKFTVVAPDGRNVVNITETNPLGLRFLSFESPELQDINVIKKGYPEGEYKFSGITASGKKLNATKTLRHAIAPPASILHPKDATKNVSIKSLDITWSAVKNVAGYIIAIEEIGSDNHLKARLPANTTTLSVPNGFLLPGKEYSIGIGTVTASGNATFSETTFSTSSLSTAKP